ncbi:hypothetical protein WJX73_002596 [Symbiochloris irregularis]|uniref:Uncharacterized protein n=1 Tax=Symbiochloris irregularis TaxID=706552 RepID=A0AAW1NL58_9CHLO
MQEGGLSWNVKLGLIWTTLETASMSCRSGDVLSGFLFLKTKENSIVGFIQGVNGLMQLVCAFPGGWLADSTRRDRLLKLAAVLGLAAGCCLFTAVLLQLNMAFIFLAMLLMGAYRGFYNPALESLYADSVPTGHSSLYTAKHIAMQLGSCCGPILSMVLFFILGNEWKLSECRIALLAGLLLMLAPLFGMLFFNDDLTLGKASEAVTQSARVQGPEAGAAGIQPQQACCGCCCNCSPSILVLVIITFSDLLGALASGMTIKFFALFFMQACDMGPAEVSALGALGPLGISAASMLAQKASKWTGRAQTTLITRLADVVLLVSMAFAPTRGVRAQSLLVGMHLLRTALANCTRPLLRSLLMDYTPKRHRGKVNALDSVRTLSWSGSAALGGLLIQLYGFQTTFIITACIKLSAWLPLAALPFLSKIGSGAM